MKNIEHMQPEIIRRRRGLGETALRELEKFAHILMPRDAEEPILAAGPRAALAGAGAGGFRDDLVTPGRGVA